MCGGFAFDVVIVILIIIIIIITTKPPPPPPPKISSTTTKTTTIITITHGLCFPSIFHFSPDLKSDAQPRKK